MDSTTGRDEEEDTARRFPMEAGLRRLTIPVAAVAAIALLSGCGAGDASDDRAAIEQAIRGYVAFYNASDVETALTYFTDYRDRADALSFLAVLRSQSGEMTLVNFDPEAIGIEGSTAKVPIEFRLGDEPGFQMLNLIEEDGVWKILWDQ